MNEELAVLIGSVIRLGIPFVIMMLVGGIVNRRPARQLE
jgi:hypothetical protein